MSTPHRHRRLRPLTWAGLTIAAVGSAPLLAVIAAAEIGWLNDPNPNPVGPGILAALTFWPGLALAGVGAARSVLDALRERSRPR